MTKPTTRAPRAAVNDLREGIELLNAIQDVYLDRDVTIA